MLERGVRLTLFFGALAPILLLSKFIGDHMHAGLSKSDAVVMSLGYLTPISWLFLLALFGVEVWRNRQLSK